MGELDRYVFYIGSQIFSLNILEHLRTSQNISEHLRKSQNKLRKSQNKLRNILGYIGRSLGGIWELI